MKIFMIYKMCVRDVNLCDDLSFPTVWDTVVQSMSCLLVILVILDNDLLYMYDSVFGCHQYLLHLFTNWWSYWIVTLLSINLLKVNYVPQMQTDMS